MSRIQWIALGLASTLVVVTPTISQASPASQAMKPSDATLQDRIAYRLDTDAAVRKYDVKVKVEMGIAMLSGRVATAAQKLEVARVAKIEGISRVENDVVVDPAVDKTLADRIKGGFSKTGDKIDDAWITTKVKWFYMGEDLLKGSDINVDTSKNVVTLKGTVKSAAGQARAVALAKNAEGVVRVVDQLKVVK